MIDLYILRPIYNQIYSQLIRIRVLLLANVLSVLLTKLASMKQQLTNYGLPIALAYHVAIDLVNIARIFSIVPALVGI